MSEKRRSSKAPAASGNESPMDVRLLEQIVKLMAANDLNTVDVRDGDRRVILKRGAVTIAPAAYAAPAALAPAGSHAPAPSSTGAGEAADDDKLLKIKSPMVGTFYAAPAKGAKPFVTVGSVVEEDTDVCIIEAMKVFNNIKAECRGTIVKVLIGDGQPVEFGTVLFHVKPT